MSNWRSTITIRPSYKLKPHTSDRLVERISKRLRVRIFYTMERDRNDEVYPFWGNEDYCEIGLTRTDFDLSDKGVRIEPKAILLGSIFSAIKFFFETSEGAK